MNLVSILHDRAEATPEAIAIRDVVDGRDRSITYRELSRQVAAGAAFLTEQGLKPGDTVLLVHPIRIELYEVLLAVFHAGLTAMLVDPSADRAFIEACCRRRVPDAYFGSPKAHLLRLAIPALRKVRRAIHCGGWVPFSRAWSTSAAPAPPAACTDETPALLTFTSGSTGAPKAAVRTHGFLQAQYGSLSRALELAEGDIDLVTLPVFVLANLAAGVTSAIADTDLRAPGRADAERIRAQCERLGVTRCTASPAFFEALLAHPKGPPRLAILHTGGGPVFLDLLDRLQRALPAARVMALYGSTEAEPIADQPAATLSEDDRMRASGGGGLPAGQPVDDVELLILPDRFGEPVGPFSSQELHALALPPDEVGEIVVAGDHVLSGYLDGQGDEETKIHVEGRVWHRTGDSGCLDRAGRLWLHGRCTARLPRGVYPLAIEAALRDLPGCPRTAALAHEGSTVLVVEGEPAEDIRAGINQRVGTLVDRIVSLPTIPLDRRHNAKVDYPALREALQAARL